MGGETGWNRKSLDPPTIEQGREKRGDQRGPEGRKEELITPRCCLKVKQESAKPAKPAVEHVNLN